MTNQVFQKKSGAWEEIGVKKSELSDKADNVLSSYSKPSSTSAITTTDNVSQAIGKVERALDDKAAEVLTGYSKPSTTSSISATDKVIEAIGKLEAKADSKQDAFGTATEGQSIRYNATTGKWEPFTLPVNIQVRDPKTGDEIGAITPSATINGELHYCTADGTGTYATFRAGCFYLCTTSDGTTYGWFSMGNFIDLSAYQLKNLGSSNKDKVLITDSDGNISSSSVTVTELDFLSGVTSGVQKQIDDANDLIVALNARLVELEDAPIPRYGGDEVLTVTAPTAGFATATATIAVTGTATAGDTVFIRVNDGAKINVTVPTGTGVQTWTQNVTLTEGSNTIKVVNGSKIIKVTGTYTPAP